MKFKRTEPFIDKFSLTFNIRKHCQMDKDSIGQELIDSILTTLNGKAGDPNDSLTRIYRRDNNNIYKQNFQLLLGTDNSPCTIGVDSIFGVADFRIEWNPIHDPDNEVWDLLKFLFIADYDTFYNNAVVTRNDLAFDVSGASMHSFLFECADSQTCNIRYGSNGKRETISFGVTGSQFFLRIYDKSAQMLALGQPIDPHVIRIEAQTRPRVLLRDLQSIPNPFEKLTIGRSIDPTKLPSNDDRKIFFFDYACRHGLRNALRILPEYQRKAMRAWFKKYHSERLYDSSELESGVRTAIRKILKAAAPYPGIRRRGRLKR